MPIPVEFKDDECIAVVSVVGNPEASEIEDVNRLSLLPFIQENAPNTVDIIWDVREFEWDFHKFINFIKLAKERRSQGNTPTNMKQYYVGHNTWIQNFRTWLYKNFGEETALFTNVEDALAYVREQSTDK